jgi:hypothetical protein
MSLTSSHPAQQNDADQAPLGAGIDFSDPNSPLAPFYCRASHVCAAALLGLVFVFFSFVPLWHTDIWGHLSYGRWMVENGRLPAQEPFCAQSDPAVGSLHTYWLIQLGLYHLYHAGELLAGGDARHRMEGGVAVLRITLAALLTLRCGMLLLAFRRLGAALPLALAALLLMLAASIGHITVLRPQVAGEVLFAGMLLVLSRSTLSRSAVLLVPLLLAVWVNVHGSYPAGLVLLGCCLAGRGLAAWRTAGGANPLGALKDAGVRRLLLATLLGLGAILLLNPHGPRVLLDTMQMGRHPNVNDMDEWQPLWKHATGALAWVYAAGLVLVAGAQLSSTRWFKLEHVFILLAFAMLPLLHLRMMVWWFMVVPWLVCAQWPGRREGLALDGSWLQSVPSLRKTLLAAVLLVLLASWSLPARWVSSGEPGPLERSVFQATPWQLAEQLRDRQSDALPALHGELVRRYAGGQFQGGVFASETQGDYLVWALSPEVPVFIYTHVHLFTPSAWQECKEVKFGGPAWKAVLDARGINLVVAEAEMYPQLRALLWADVGWQVVVDETGDAVKRDGRARVLIALRKKPVRGAVASARR